MSETLEPLRALVSELRGRLGPNLSKRQCDDIGMYLLKAVWLGEGKPLSLVFEPINYEPERPNLRLVR